MSDTKKILEQYKNNEISLEEALLELKKEPFADIGYAKVDLHRKVRQGAAEVIYGEGKTPEQMIGICDAMLKSYSYKVDPKLFEDELSRFSTNKQINTLLLT